jgi:transposase
MVWTRLGDERLWLPDKEELLLQVRVIGLDTAKHVFQVHGADKSGRAVLRKRLRRSQVAGFLGGIPECIVGLEATRGPHYWACVIGSFGHQVLRSQKNDAGDAAAICEAVSHPEMRFVPQKSIEQQDLQALHRIRSRLIVCRTQLGNQIRGLLAEYGVILPLHLSEIRGNLPAMFSEEHPLLSRFARELLADLYQELCALDRRLHFLEGKIQTSFADHALCQKIAHVEGVGPVIANGGGRSDRGQPRVLQWATVCGLAGLVPRQHLSGDKQRLLGITKRGDPYLRMLLIHGARSVVYRAA